jgi:UDP-N-acetyl-D-glucosamine dehydrogenase
VVRPLLEASGLSHGSDFLLAYSPEREDPGNAEHGVGRTPKVVGGESDLARELASALYGTVVPRTIPVSSTGTAEAVKLTENVFRAVNIALVNELKVIYGRMGIDIWEVIEAAKSKPFGFMAFYPGPGLGGHCIPIDPFYLAWRARQFDAPARFVELAGEINAAMPALVVERLLAALRTRSGIGLDGARILLLGVAYKPNVGDVRESPAFALWELLEAQGASVCYHDPHVAVLPPTREHRKLAGIESQALTADLLAAVDGVLICTDHAAVDYALVVEHARLIVDTRNATAAVRAGRANVVLA